MPIFRTIAAPLRALFSSVTTYAAVIIATIAFLSPAQAEDASDWLASSFRKSQSAERPSGLGRKAGTSYASKRRSSNDDDDDNDRPRRRRSKGVETASLGDTYIPQPSRRSLSGGGGARWAASSGCLNSTLAAVIADVSANYGSVTVSSTCRSHSHNASVGGAKKSYHLTGDAADFRVHGNWGAAYSYLRSNGAVGGLKHYGGGLFHIDTGPRRSW